MLYRTQGCRADLCYLDGKNRKNLSIHASGHTQNTRDLSKPSQTGTGGSHLLNKICMCFGRGHHIAVLKSGLFVTLGHV